MSPPVPSEELPLKADGAAGERYAAAILTCALCAQASNTTLQEEGKKLDLKISLLNAFNRHKSIISVHGQIRHGTSFARRTADTITLQNLGEDTIPTLQEGSQPALLIWVPPWPDNKIYWHVVRTKGKHRSPIRIGKRDFVTPGLRFELSRFANFERRSPRYPCLDTPQLTAESIEVAIARKHYRQLKSKSLHNPLLGCISVTRLAWRHITRRSRTTSRRHRSFHALRYLKSFLDKVPTHYIVERKGSSTKSNRVSERNEIVFWYRHALRIDGEVQTLLVRFIEDIEYPKNWQQRPLSESEVSHKVTLMSWWFKPENEVGASVVHTDVGNTRKLAIVNPSVTLPRELRNGRGTERSQASRAR